jgi:hypothetical protein
MCEVGKLVLLAILCEWIKSVGRVSSLNIEDSLNIEEQHPSKYTLGIRRPFLCFSKNCSRMSKTENMYVRTI